MVPVGEVDESGWVVAAPARVTRLGELGEVLSGRVDRDGALTELVAELAKSRTGYSSRRGVVREVVVGRGVPVSVGEADPDGVGFIMVVFVAWAGRRGAADKSPVRLARMYAEAMRELGRHRMRMVIGVNRWNDPNSDLSTAELEEQLRGEVLAAQAEINGLGLAGVSVVGHVVEAPVWDRDGRVVDGDVWREVRRELSARPRNSPLRQRVERRLAEVLTTRMTGRRRKERAGSQQFLLERQLNFPHAGVQHAIVGSATFLRYWGELGQVHPNRVFVHFGDSDVVSLTNPRGGNSQSVFDHFTEVISRSHPSEGGFSALVRLGGAVAYSTDEIDTYLVEAGYLPPRAFGGEPSPLAKFNALLAQANQLIAAELATGDYPVGYFLEPNTLINADYLGPLRTSDGNTTDGLLPAMSQLSATRARGFANTYAVHRRLRELRLHKRPHSRFLGRREAQVQTSTRGARRTYVWKHLHEVADEVTVTDEVTGEVARWVPKFPGRTLFVLGAKQLATNFTFNPTRLLATLGSLTGLGSREKVKELFDPDRRAAALARLDPTRRRETARKLVAMYKVNSRVETLMSNGLTGTLDELFDYLRRYGEQPDPDWYVNELDRFGDTAARTPHVDLDLSDLDASDSDVDLPDVDLPAVEAGSGARRQTRSVSPGPEPAAALDDVLADLLRGLRLADDPPTADPRTAPDGDAMDIDDVHGPAGDGVVDVDAGGGRRWW